MDNPGVRFFLIPPAIPNNSRHRNSKTEVYKTVRYKRFLLLLELKINPIQQTYIPAWLGEDLLNTRQMVFVRPVKYILNIQ